MSDNLDNLLTDIYSSEQQSQGVKELANLINNLSQLLLKAISQLESRVGKIEQQMSRGSSSGLPPPSPMARTPPAPAQRAPSPVAATPPAPKPKAASPFSAPAAPAPPPATASVGPSSAAEAAGMLGVTLKKAPAATSPVAAPASSSGPSFLSTTVSPSAPKPAAATPAAAPVSTMGGPPQPDAVAPASAGVAGPAGGFRGELAEKLARRRQKVQKQIDDDFDAPDLEVQPDSQMGEEAPAESTSSELKLDLEDELRSAFSKLKD